MEQTPVYPLIGIPSRRDQSSRFHEKCGRIDEARDAVELTLARWALADGLPVFGICRGIQVLNVAAGGTLYQDIASQVPGSLKHDYWPGHPRNLLTHQVTVNNDSHLAAILSGAEVAVNSLHHQAVKDLAPNFMVVARSPDGLIEAIEGHGHPFALGVQWHPEGLVEDAPPMRRLFEEFVSAARS